MKLKLSIAEYFLPTIIFFILSPWGNSAFSQSAIDYEKALSSFNQENYDEAYIYLKNALQDSPSHLQSKLMMADILLRRKQTRAAIIEYEESVALGADINIAFLPLAKAFTRIRDYDNVIKLSTATLNPNNTFEITLLQAVAYENTLDIEKALEKYLAAYELQQDNIEAINNIAGFFLRQYKLDKSAYYIERAESVVPDNAHTLHLRGQLHQEQGALPKALFYFQAAYEKLPSDPFISRSLANTYVSLKQFDKARIIVDNILTLTPDEPFIMLLNARLFSINEHNELAFKVYEEINKKLALIPNELLLRHSELLLVSGLALYMTENYESARNKLINYVSYNPENIYALEILIDIHIQLGESRMALKLLENQSEMIKESLSLSLVLCDLYLKSNKIHRCQSLISELRDIHNADRVLNLMEVKTLLARQNFSEALTYFEKKFTDTSGREVKKIAARLYLQNKQEKRALKVVNELVTLVPDNFTYQLLKSDILIAMQRLDEAQRLTSNILKLEPNLFPARYNRAKIHYLNLDYQEALKQAENLIKDQPNSFRVRILMANILFSTGQLEKAKDAFNIAKLFDKENTLPYEKNVQIYRAKGNFSGALKELDRLQMQHFLNTDYIQLRADIYLQQQNLDKAAEQFTKLFTMWKSDHEKLLYLGQRQRISNIYEDAETTLLQALTLTPTYLYAKIELMRLYITTSEIEKAENILNTFPTLTQQKPNLQLIMGDIALAKNNNEQAKVHYLSAIEQNNNYQAAIIQLFNLAKNKGTGASEFINTLTTIVNQFPSAHFHRHILADFLYFNKHHQAAKTHYLLLEKTSGLPRLEFLYNNLANLLLVENFSKAIHYADLALSIDKHNPSFIDTKGWILTNQSQLVEGLDLLREAAAKDASNPAIQYHIGYNLFKSGQLKAARNQLNKAISSKDKFSERELAITLLQSI
jgi:putative PEP-CTERM system TPR-repeat lipoprotein